MKQAGTLTGETIESILAEPKVSPVGEETTRLKYRKFFPPDYSPKQVEAVIISLLCDWRKTQMA
jgi:ParB family chromosome partitioning protein